jgi:hypothetical protein
MLLTRPGAVRAPRLIVRPSPATDVLASGEIDPNRSFLRGPVLRDYLALNCLTFARLANSGLLQGAHSAFGRMRDRQDSTHIVDKRLAKALSVAW